MFEALVFGKVCKILTVEWHCVVSIQFVGILKFTMILSLVGIMTNADVDVITSTTGK